MPPLVIELGLAFAIIASTIKVTIAVSRLEQNQKVSQAEVLGEVKVIHSELKALKDDTKELREEVKETRKFRFSDKPNG